MHSDLVVISWWSNCLGLTCLEQLARYTRHMLYVVQVGKSEQQKQLFRRCLPSGVQELPYPADAPAEHSRVIADVVYRQLPSAAGLWFVDHDFFVHQTWEDWLKTADFAFDHTPLCLCLPPPGQYSAITQPVFWLSPRRLPAGLSFDPLPFQPRPESRRPDLYRYQGGLQMPQKDTLVQARDVLTTQGKAGHYSFANFPSYTHLGGLFLFAQDTIALPPAFQMWQERVIADFTNFFAACPAEWLVIEDPVLLARWRESKGVTHA